MAVKELMEDKIYIRKAEEEGEDSAAEGGDAEGGSDES